MREQGYQLMYCANCGRKQHQLPSSSLGPCDKCQGNSFTSTPVVQSWDKSTSPAEPAGGTPRMELSQSAYDALALSAERYKEEMGVQGQRAEDAIRRVEQLERELAEAQVTLRRTKADLDCAEENFHVTNQAYVKADNALSQAKRDAEREPVWIVNDLGELGVKIGHRFLFLYKGDNLEYETGKHDDGSQMMWRIVGKREFGECCYPLRWITNRYSEDRYRENPVFTPGLSFGKPEDGEWKPLPAALAKREGEES